VDFCKSHYGLAKAARPSQTGKIKRRRVKDFFKRMNGEKMLTKTETRRRLGVGRSRYEQLIASGILPPPFSIIAGARPVHSESQILIAEQNIYRRAIKALQPESGRKMKPLSNKFISEIS